MAIRGQAGLRVELAFWWSKAFNLSILVFLIFMARCARRGNGLQPANTV